MVSARTLVAVLIMTVGVSFGNIFVSRGMKQIGDVTMVGVHGLLPTAARVVTNPWVLFGTFLLMLYYVAFLSVLSWEDVSLVIPLAAFHYVLIALLANRLLGEEVSIDRWIGIALIAAGVAIMLRR